MAIKDGRILVANGSESNEGVPPTWDHTGLGGGDRLSADTEYYFSSSQSIAWIQSTNASFVYYDTNTGNDWTNNEFYIIMASSVIPILSAAGIRMRFAGTNINDWFEILLGTTSKWPLNTVGTGWYQFVVDINAPRYAESSAGVLTPPSSIQYVGLSQVTASTARASLNSWIDSIWRRPYANPALIIEGTNGGSPYTWEDVRDDGITNQRGIFVNGPGGSYTAAGPIQIGNNSTGSTHEFEDSNVLILWDTQINSNAYSYKIEFVNTSGSTLNVKAGEKTGTGSTSIGSQGWTIQAAEFANTTTYANRWSLIANNNYANVNLYGCTFSHSDIIRAESTNTEIVSTFFIDGNELVQSTTAGSSLLVRNTVVNANTADGEAYIKTVDLGNIRYNTSNFSDGHAIEITSLPLSANLSTQSSIENIFQGYSTSPGSTDASIYNNSGQSLTISHSGGALDINSYRNGVAGSNTFIENNVTVTITNVLPGSEVRMWYYSYSGIVGAEVPGGVESTTQSDVPFTLPGNSNTLVKVYKTDYNIEKFELISQANLTRRVDQTKDRVYLNP